MTSTQVLRVGAVSAMESKGSKLAKADEGRCLFSG